MKLVVDMNLSPGWVTLLAGSGFDVVHWSLVGRPTDPDDVILEWAVANSAVVMTCDLDFSSRLRASGVSKPSIVQIRVEDARVAVAGPAVLSAISVFQAELSAGAVVTIGEKARCRLLPLADDLSPAQP